RLTEYVEEKLEETGANDIGLLAGVLEQITDEVEPLSDLESLKEKAQGLLEQVKQFAASRNGQGEAIPYPEGIDPNDNEQGLIEQLLTEGKTLSEALVEIMLKPLVLSFLELLAFLVIFIVCSAVIKLLIRASKVLNKVPLLGGVNRFFGGVCGLAEGVLVLYVVGIVLRMAAAAASSDSLITTQLLQETKLLSSIIYFLN
ncbi:MAG: CvpA family protein, partial [Oscillospiraceae bacterium]|nr:CvpA family protein [Oscillospiraceae bacterium]